MDTSIFSKYLDKNYDDKKHCIKNHKNKRYVFVEEIDGKKYYIKKFVLNGRRGKLLALGFREDKADRNIRISNELDELNINHVRPIFTAKARYSLLQVASIIVTEDGGEILETYAENYEEHVEIFNKFFDIFIKLCKNGIFPDDFSFANALINKKKEILLFDFDEYRTRKFFITKKFRENILLSLRRCLFSQKAKNYKKFVEFCYKEIDRVRKELDWEDIT
ncbi:MAG: hypothetical protein LBT51_10030 [Fusobacteriaceae bacterium]|jgi:hypothetical protein|nr:hypothetical protein [Fusobacteriaceae bacterium]